MSLTHAWRPLLCVVNVGLLDHFIPFFIRTLPTHISSRDADSVQGLVQSSEFALKRNGQLFVVLQSQPRVFSLSVIALTSPLSFDFARWFTTAGGQFGVHFRVSSDSSSAVMSSSGSMIVTFLLVVVTCSGDSFSTLSCAAWCGRHLLRYHVCRKTCLLSRLSAPSLCVTSSPFGALIGPPTAFRRSGPSVLWVSLPGPTGVMMSHQSANPLWLCRAGGLGRDRGRDCHVDLSCGRRSYKHSSNTFSEQKDRTITQSLHSSS